jgi:hypothetical protein
MCAPRVTRYTSIRYSSSYHTRVNMDASYSSLLQWSVPLGNLNIVPMCAVSPVVDASNTSSCQNFFQFSCGCEQFHKGRSFGFLVINVCTHRERCESPCIIVWQKFIELSCNISLQTKWRTTNIHTHYSVVSTLHNCIEVKQDKLTGLLSYHEARAQFPDSVC